MYSITGTVLLILYNDLFSFSCDMLFAGGTLSLRLCAQLMFGIVRVCEKQVQYLLGENYCILHHGRNMVRKWIFCFSGSPMHTTLVEPLTLPDDQVDLPKSDYSL